MHQVKGEYPDYQRPSLKNNFYLDPDQSFNHQTWKPPINWKGFVGGQEVKFSQIESDGNTEDCFDWKDFPKELNSAKPYIVEAIDDAMRIMD